MASLSTWHTDRLRAMRLWAEDFDALCRMHRDPGVMATLGGCRSDDQTRQFLDTSLQHWDRYGYGLWMVHAMADAQFVGRAGLRHVHVGGNDEVEVAYALMAPFWGRGLATEIARAVVTVAFEHLGMADLVAFTLPTNRASQRVMEKVGYRFERAIVHAGLPHVLYRIQRPAGGGDPTAGPGEAPPVRPPGGPVESLPALPEDPLVHAVHHGLPPGPHPAVDGPRA